MGEFVKDQFVCYRRLSATESLRTNDQFLTDNDTPPQCFPTRSCGLCWVDQFVFIVFISFTVNDELVEKSRVLTAKDILKTTVHRLVGYLVGSCQLFLIFVFVCDTKHL